jgi:putative ABC transport system permease protein
MMGTRIPIALRVAARLLPPDVRDEVLRELLEQHARRRARSGAIATALWTVTQPWAAWRARDRTHAGAMWADASSDLAIARRAILRRPALSAAVAATIAITAGAVAAIAGVLDAVWLRPLPYPDAGQLVWLTSHEVSPGSRPFDPATAANSYNNPLDVIDVAQRSRHLAALTPFETFESTILTGERPMRVDVASVRAAVNDVLRITPMYGRLFTADDERPGGRVMILSQRLWRSAFGSDPSVVGRRVDLDGAPFEIVGVLPDLPLAFPTADTDVWLPLRVLPPGFSNRGGVWQRVVARVDDGAAIADAQADLSRIARELAAEHPDTNGERQMMLVPYRAGVVGATAMVLRLVAGAVLLVLVIGCANVGHLLVVGAQARRRELAVRAALGAGTWRIARLLLAETAWLAGAGGVIGLLLAPWLLQMFVRLYPGTLPAVGTISVSMPAIAAGLVAMVVAALLAMLPSIVHLARRGGRLQTEMRTAERGSEHRAQRRMRATLVVTQVALSTALLLGAGLLLRTFWTMRATNPGFAASERVLTFNIALGDQRYPTLADEVRFYDALFERLRALPTVTHAGATTLLPLTPGEFGDGIYRVGFDDRPPKIPLARLQNVTAGYFEAIGLPLVAGRTLQRTDTAAAARVVVVNETFQRDYFPDGALGRQIKFRGVVSEIVGVVGDKQHRSLRERPRADMYFPRAQVEHPRLFSWVAVRTSADPTALTSAVRDAVTSLDPAIAIDNVDTMQHRLDEALAPDRFRAQLVGALAVVALVLAGIGLYGLIAFAVARDARDIAIRIALGARARSLVARVVRSALVLTTMGVVAGGAVAAASRELVAHFLVGVTAFDLPTLVATTATLLLVAALASAGPARRASRVDAGDVLRRL